MDDWSDKFKDKLEEYRYPEEPSDEKVADFFQRMDLEEPSMAPKKNSYMLLKVAASVVLLMAAAFMIYNYNQVTIHTASGEIANVVLPDGSKVSMSHGSSMSYNKISWNFSRIMFFKGEGFFEVKEGKVFAVISPTGETKVLGTSFNINTKQSYEVKCYTGEVRVRAGTDEVILKKGESAALAGQELVTESFDDTAPHWTSGEVYFDNEPLQRVINQLEGYYNLSFSDLAGTSELTYTGYFPADNLSLALRLVFDPFDIVYEDKGDGNYQLSYVK